MAEKMMILTSSYHFGEELRTMANWSQLGMEVVSIEYNGAIGLEQFAYFKPRIVLLDSMVPIIGIDKFVDEMSRVNSDFLVILLDGLNSSISNIQNIYRTIDKMQLDIEVLTRAVKDAVKTLNKKFDPIEEYDTGERAEEIRKVVGDGEFTMANLQLLRDSVGLNFSSQVSILLPRPVKYLNLPYSRGILNAIWNILHENAGGEVLIMNDGLLCILINDGNGALSEKVYENLVMDIRRTLINEYSIQWTFILSNPIPLRKLMKEYFEYRKLYEYGYFRSELPILKKEYIATKSLIRKDKKKQLNLGMVADLVISGGEEEIKIVFKQIYLDYLKNTMNFQELERFRHTLELLWISFVNLYELKGKLDGVEKAFDARHHTLESEMEVISGCFLQLQSACHESKKRINELIYPILIILIEQYSGQLSLQSVAEEVNIATTYLSHLFKKEMKCTFNNYVTMMRLAVAKRMLWENKYKIHEIAVRVGFSDNRYFSRVFKKETGMSPSEYKYFLEQSKEKEV